MTENTALSFFHALMILFVGVFTWQGRSQAMWGSTGVDAPDNAVKQEIDLLSFWTGQEENSSPWNKDGEETKKAAYVSYN